MPRICIIGQYGVVSLMLQERLKAWGGASVTTISSEEALTDPNLGEHPQIREADLVVLCVQDFASPQLVSKLTSVPFILDISPAYRTAPGWQYGFSTRLTRRTEGAGTRVANPGCFATAAILALAPLSDQGLLSEKQPIYLDAVGGYSTGGNALVEKVQSGEFSSMTAFSFSREHRHIAEIEYYARTPAPVWFVPKIGTHARGILLQTPILAEPHHVKEAFDFWYKDTDVTVFEGAPTRLAADVWSHRSGAGLYVVPQREGCIVVCVMDNLLKGAVDTAFENIFRMLT
jgi:N-acetyl-gamma-glutamyl-phosphate reductase